MSAIEFTWVDSQQSFDTLVSELHTVDRFALDTEFHREGRYWPELALLQIGTDNGVWLVDAPALGLARSQPPTANGVELAQVLTSGATAVLHAAEQDLEVLYLTTGAVPAVMFDTQLAARLLGNSTASLTKLVQRYTEHRMPSTTSLVDWFERPLPPEQQQYAAADVAYLLPLTDTLTAQLDELGRLNWTLDECEQARQPPKNAEPDQAGRRIREVRRLKGTARSRAEAVAEWREREAQRRNVPVRQVLSDIAVAAIGQRGPTDAQALSRIRGVPRSLPERMATGLLTAVRDSPNEATPEAEAAPFPGELRPAASLIGAWLDQVARTAQIDPALLATRADVETLLAALHAKPRPNGEHGGLTGLRDAGRLATGWRSELLGSELEQLLAGHKAVAFKHNAGLVTVNATTSDHPESGSF